MKKKKIIDANSEMTEILELSNKDFKADIIKMPQQTIRNILETNEQ